MYDNTKEDAFYLYQEDGKCVKFTRNEEGLYYCLPEESYVEEVAELNDLCHLIITMEDNQEGFTNGQVKRAKQA